MYTITHKDISGRIYLHPVYEVETKVNISERKVNSAS